MKPATVVLALAALAVLVVGGTFAFTRPAAVNPDAMQPVKGQFGSAELDGLAFVGKLGPAGKPADVEDRLVFANGMFLSAECERRCNYPASPYYVRKKGERLEFISETRCPNKDATLVWRGTFDGTTLKGEFTWTSSRWYWTFEKTFRFEGTVAETTASIAAN